MPPSGLRQGASTRFQWKQPMSIAFVTVWPLISVSGRTGHRTSKTARALQARSGRHSYPNNHPHLQTEQEAVDS
jgi:hypothetical protein